MSSTPRTSHQGRVLPLSSDACGEFDALVADAGLEGGLRRPSRGPCRTDPSRRSKREPWQPQTTVSPSTVPSLSEQPRCEQRSCDARSSDSPSRSSSTGVSSTTTRDARRRCSAARRRGHGPRRPGPDRTTVWSGPTPLRERQMAAEQAGGHERGGAADAEQSGRGRMRTVPARAQRTGVERQRGRRCERRVDAARRGGSRRSTGSVSAQSVTPVSAVGGVRGHADRRSAVAPARPSSSPTEDVEQRRAQERADHDVGQQRVQRRGRARCRLSASLSGCLTSDRDLLADRLAGDRRGLAAVSTASITGLEGG